MMYIGAPFLSKPLMVLGLRKVFSISYIVAGRLGRCSPKEKAHSILHKVRELLLFGWSENVSTQGPEHCHIDFCKKVAVCTINKDVFLTILRPHIREGQLQYLQKLHADLADEDSETVLLRQSAEEWLARNDSISCELGIRYLVLQAILSVRKNHQT